MDISPRPAQGRPIINAYGDGGFRIAGTLHKGSVLIWPERFTAWSVTDFSLVTMADFQPILQTIPRIEILLCGVGVNACLPSPELRQAMRAAGISFDCMGTGAACRTFNVLLSEDRRVGAALIAIS